MTKFTFDVETCTPLFMHGARGVEFSEVRASEFRGKMRAWFRTLAGPGMAVDDLRQAEEEVFGRSGDTRPRLSVHAHLDALYREVTSRESNPLPHKELAKVDALKLVKEGTKAHLPSSIRPGTRIQIAVLVPAVDASSERRAELAYWSLWTAINFGGFGARSSRGCGSLVVKSIVTPMHDDDVRAEFASAEELASYLQRGLERATEAFRRAELQRRGDGGPSVYPVFSPERESTRVIVVDLGEKSESEARAELFMRMREFKNPAFGLPLKVSTGWAKFTPSAPHESRIRHASPLGIRLVPCGSRFAAVCRFVAPVPAAEGLDVQQIHAFLDSFQDRATAVTVPSF